MNVRLLKRVRDTIARSRTRWRFDMASWLVTTNGAADYIESLADLDDAIARIRSKECGTVGCIAGWTVIEGYRSLKKMDLGIHADVEDGARELLDLGYEDATYLFMGHWSRDEADLRRVTKREALDYLDECVAAKEIVRRPA
jgi:hypothetical protein